VVQLAMTFAVTPSDLQARAPTDRHEPDGIGHYGKLKRPTFGDLLSQRSDASRPCGIRLRSIAQLASMEHLCQSEA
jgi:hypothetical protein